MNGIRRGPVPFIAVALIVIGAVLLLDRLGVIRFGVELAFWSLVMVFGLSRVVLGFSRGTRGRIFAGTLMFLWGLFFLLRSADFLEFRIGMFPAAFFLIFGIALLMMFLNNVREWELLFPALFLCGIGAALVLGELGYLDRYEVWDAVRLYWPVALVVVGVALLFRRRAHIQQESSPPTSSANAG